MCLVIELDVLNASIGGSNYALIILVVHLGRNDRILSLDTCDHIWVIRGHHLGMLVCIPDDATLSARDYNLCMSVDNAANGFAEDKLFFTMLEPIKLIDITHVLGGRVDCCNGAICCAKQN